MSSYTTCSRTVSIGESGLTTLQLAVQHDEPTAVRLTIEDQLPDVVDLDAVAADRETGKWALYDDGTFQWSVSVGPETTATGTIGFEIVDPDVVDELADDATTTIIRGDPPAPPVGDAEAVDTVTPRPLADATCDRRVPEAVYERVHELDVRTTDDVASQQPIPAGMGCDHGAKTAKEDPAGHQSTDDQHGQTSHAQSASSGGTTTQPEETTLDDEGTGTGTTTDESSTPTTIDQSATSTGDHSDATSTSDQPATTTTDQPDATPDESPGGEDTPERQGSDGAWRGDTFENAIRRIDGDSRTDESAYRFVLDFEQENATEHAIEILEGLLNGTTVFGAEPPLSELRHGANPDALTATISSAICEESIVGALEAISDTTLEHFETLDDPQCVGDDLASDPSHRFELLSEVVDPTAYEEFGDEVAAIEDCAFDFGSEPVSFDDLVDDPVAAADLADEADEVVEDTEPGDRTATSTSGATGRVIERLLDELETGGVTERERIELRRRLGVDASTSTEVRLDHLHSRVDKFAAYTDALESFIDDEGTAETILEELRDEVASLDDRTTELESSLEERTTDLEARLEEQTATLDASLDHAVADAADERDGLADRLDDLTRSQRETRTDLDDLADRHAAEAERVDGIAQAVGSNTDDIEQLADDVRGELDALQATVESLESNLGDVTGRFDDLESRLDDRIDDLERRMDDQMDDLETRLDDRLDEIEETVEENARVRSTLESLAN